ncbi:MAG: pyruvate kinase [Oscillospiraceae bacterium]|jgi:pyruvate kinase
MKKTKIVCTLGYASETPEVIEQLMLAGMDVARFNFSHGTHEEHKKKFDIVVELRKKHRRAVATLLDTKGPEVRLGVFEDGKAFLETGASFILTTREVMGTSLCASVSYQGLPNDLKVGDTVLLDDGLIELRVERIKNNDIHCLVINGGPISDRKGVNLPGVHLSIPYVSEQDRTDILFGIECGFDFIAASFVRTASDILQIREILHQHNADDVRIIAKIENAEGVNNIDEILRVSDGIMVARGDMGVEIPFEEVPALQKHLIQKAYTASKMVITATQMLESMQNHPRPTRAEATDVANAIYDGTSAIMLSGETAAGKYPIKAVETMAMIAKRTEADIDYKKRFFTRGLRQGIGGVTDAISHATCTTAYDLNASAIIAVTISGHTARMISKFRPDIPILGCTSNPRTYQQLALSWGVVPVMLGQETNLDELFSHAVSKACDLGLVSSGELVVITTGVPLGIAGTTNLIKVHVAGDVLVTGTGIGKGSVSANLCVASSEEDALLRFKRGDILVVPSTSNNLISLLKNAAGIITEEAGADSHAAIAGLALDIPVLVGAAGATGILKSGTIVTLDAAQGAVINAAD